MTAPPSFPWWRAVPSEQPHAQERRTSARRPASSPTVLAAAGRHGKEDMEWDREQIIRKTFGRFLCPQRKGTGRAFGGHRRYTGHQNSRSKGGRRPGPRVPADEFKSHLQCCGDYHRPERGPGPVQAWSPWKGACQSWKKHWSHLAQHKGPQEAVRPSAHTTGSVSGPSWGVQLGSCGAEEPKTSGSDEKGLLRLYGIQVLLCSHTLDHRGEDTHLKSSTSPDPHTSQASAEQSINS